MKFIYRIVFCSVMFVVSPTHANAVLLIESTTQDLAAIASAVGGQYVKSSSLTMGTRDPHFAVAKPSMIRRVHKADLLLLVGADLEIGWLPLLLKSARNPQVQPGNPGYLDLSEAVTLTGVSTVGITRDMGDVHEKGNPHYWLDPRNGIKIANAIAKQLSKLAPEQAEVFQSNAVAFADVLNAKFIEWKQALRHLKNKPVITYHSSLDYLAAAFEFNIVAQVEPKPGIAPSAASLSRLIDKIEKNKISLLIMEPYYERRSSAYLQQQTGIMPVIIPQSVGAQPGIENYADLFDAIIKELKIGSQ
ncbi:MAG: metal ABC transporter substrate-binding protein [Gammaproteobacteria bacterium]|nr:metal ABC transporter substrate-binding protein [Gammaproteobacteria bacterium]